jgi:hypothetical protein
MPGTARALEFNGWGIAYRSFNCWLQPSEKFGFEYLHARPLAVSWAQCQPLARYLGFCTGCDANGNYAVQAPYWTFCAAGCGVWWLRAYLIRRQERKQNRNLCVACGYDLRATPQRCPECGTVAGAVDAAV